MRRAMAMVGQWIPAAVATVVTSMLLVAEMVAPAGAAAASGTAPDPPANLRVTDLQPESITVGWDPVPGTLDFYTVAFLGAPYGPHVRTDELTATLPAVWDRTYQVVVRANLLLDHEPWSVVTEWSAPVTVTTPLPPDFELPSAPLNLRVDRGDGGQITLIQWDRPADGYGRLGYRLFFQTPTEPEDLSGLWAVTGDTRTDPSVTPLAAELYRPGQRITIWVTAYDRRGNESPPSTPLVLTCCPF